MFGNAQMGGVQIGFPDVCLTPPTSLPVPYPNISFGPLGFPPAWNVFWMGTPAHNLMTQPAMSVGDTPGVMLGIASHTVMGPSRPVVGAFTMLVDGMPATRMTSMYLMNTMNAPGATIVPAQVKVVILKA